MDSEFNSASSPITFRTSPSTIMNISKKYSNPLLTFLTCWRDGIDWLHIGNADSGPDLQSGKLGTWLFPYTMRVVKMKTMKIFISADGSRKFVDVKDGYNRQNKNVNSCFFGDQKILILWYIFILYQPWQWERNCRISTTLSCKAH